MKRIFCGLSCGLVMVVCCAVFLLSGGTVAAHAHAASEAACVRAGDFASHGIAAVSGNHWVRLVNLIEF